MNCKLKMGDLLYRSKGLVEHAAIYLGNNLVFHTSPKNGPETLSLEEYSEGKVIKVIHTNESDVAILQGRIEQIMQSAKRYNVLTDNCEHLASYLLLGRKLSPQLQATAVGAIVGLIIGRNMSRGGVFLSVLLCGALSCIFANATRKYDRKFQILS